MESINPHSIVFAQSINVESSRSRLKKIQKIKPRPPTGLTRQRSLHRRALRLVQRHADLLARPLRRDLGGQGRAFTARRARLEGRRRFRREKGRGRRGRPPPFVRLRRRQGRRGAFPRRRRRAGEGPRVRDRGAGCGEEGRDRRRRTRRGRKSKGGGGGGGGQRRGLWQAPREPLGRLPCASAASASPLGRGSRGRRQRPR